MIPKIVKESQRDNSYHLYLWQQHVVVSLMVRLGPVNHHFYGHQVHIFFAILIIMTKARNYNISQHTKTWCKSLQVLCCMFFVFFGMTNNDFSSTILFLRGNISSLFDDYLRIDLLVDHLID